MIKVSLNGIDIYSKYKIRLEEFNIEMPEPKLVKVSIPGRNGDLDMSEALSGFVNYSNRIITIKLGLTGDETEIENKRQSIISLVCGKKVKIEFSHLKGYFTGRTNIKTITRETYHNTMTINFDCEPFRLEVSDTTQTITLEATAKNYTFINSFMPVQPTIETSATATLKFGTKIFNLQKGVHNLGIVFIEGNNIINATGTGTMKVTYRKGVL